MFKQDVVDEIERMQVELEKMPSEDPAELIERLGLLNVYMARTGYLLALAKNDQDMAMSRIFENNIESIQKMPATIASKFISSQCEKENFLVSWLERLNRACVHQSDNIRTQVSFAKENMRLINSPYGNR